MSRPYEITKTEAAVKRYLAAFESGSLPEDQCATRVRRYGGRLIELRDRHSDLNEQLSRDTVTVPTPGYLAQVRDHVRTVLKDGTEAGRKAAMHELIHEIQATGRAEIRPSSACPLQRTAHSRRTILPCLGCRFVHRTDGCPHMDQKWTSGESGQAHDR